MGISFEYRSKEEIGSSRHACQAGDAGDFWSWRIGNEPMAPHLHRS
jgi:hypothetical protein